MDLNLKDNSYDVPRPLVVAVQELGEVAKPVVQVLMGNGQDPSIYESNIPNTFLNNIQGNNSIV